MRGLQVHKVEKVMNILHPSSKMTLLYSNELAGCSFEIIRRQLAILLYFCPAYKRSCLLQKYNQDYFPFWLNLFLLSYY